MLFTHELNQWKYLTVVICFLKSKSRMEILDLDLT